MSQEVAKREAGVPAAAQRSPQEQILKSDIVLPKILLQQALSDFVKQRKAQSGDLVRSTNGEKLGDLEVPLEFIPLTFQNLWMLSEDEKGKGNKIDYAFRGYEERNASNESMEWDFIKDGTSWKRTKVMNVYALLPRDLDRMAEAKKKYLETGELPDLDTAVLPVVIQFRNTSFKGGKDVATLFIKAADIAQQLGVEVPVYGRTMKLEVHEESNEEHDYFVLRSTESGPTKKEYLSDCNRWRTTMINMGNDIKIDESDNSGGGAAAEEPFTGQF